MPPCAGLRAHVELSVICGFIVCQTFQIAPRRYKPGQSIDNINTAMERLRTWELQLPSCLLMPKDFGHPDPSCCMLHMAHNQLIVLTTRPTFFSAVKQAVAQQIVRGESYPEDRAQGSHIQACLAAAHNNLRLAQRVRQSGRRPLQAGLHFVFNAAVILLLKRLMKTRSDNVPVSSDSHANMETSIEDQFESSVRFAVKSFEEEAKTGTHYPRDCCRILQDLDVLTYRYMIPRKQADLPQKNVEKQAHAGLHADDRKNSVTDAHTVQPLYSERAADYEEIMTWMRDDGPELHI
jgi:hypothetical protein